MKAYSLMACTLLLFLVNNARAQKNLVTNGGFEDDFYQWNNTAAQITPWDFKSGKNSCAIIAHDANNWVGIDQTVKIPKKVQALTVSAWMKAENVVIGKDPWDGSVYSIEFLDRDDKKIGDDINIATLTGDQPWNMVTKLVKVPDGAYSFKILIAMGYASVTMLIDDVSAVAVNADDLGK